MVKKVSDTQEGIGNLSRKIFLKTKEAELLAKAKKFSLLFF